jgi:hypothetical protein
MSLSIAGSILKPKHQHHTMYNTHKMLIDSNVEIHVRIINKNNVENIKKTCKFT